MSLTRLVYYSAMIGGWMAFVGWLASELLFPGGRGGLGVFSVAITFALVGAAIGAGLSVIAGMANAQWKQQIKRLVPCLVVGGVGGAIGGVIGDLLFSNLGVPRAFGWMIMGAGIGVSSGIFDRSAAKVRNGLIGGSIGGLVGGFLFDPIQAMVGSATGMASRATAFVILGMCIGVLISLVQVILKEAWLTVLDGYRPGRQLILGGGATLLGRAEFAHLPFLARGDADLEPEHARVLREGGAYVLEDNHSRLGVSVNRVRVKDRVVLKDGDVISLASNAIRFSERRGDPSRLAASTISPPSPLSSTAPSPRPSPPATEAPRKRDATRPVLNKPVGTSPPESGTCPGCGRAPASGQRYCIACDRHF